MTDITMVDTTDATLASVRRLVFGATCGYVGGSYRTSAPLLAAWPTLPHLSLSVAGEDADGLDYEPGNVHTPAGAMQWAGRYFARKVPRLPALYADLNDMPTLRSAVDLSPWPQSAFKWFLSHPTGAPGPVPDGYDAWQWLFGAGFDLSVCRPDFFGPIEVPNHLEDDLTMHEPLPPGAGAQVTMQLPGKPGKLSVGCDNFPGPQGGIAVRVAIFGTAGWRTPAPSWDVPIGIPDNAPSPIWALLAGDTRVTVTRSGTASLTATAGVLADYS